MFSRNKSRGHNIICVPTKKSRPQNKICDQEKNSFPQKKFRSHEFYLLKQNENRMGLRCIPNSVSYQCKFYFLGTHFFFSWTRIVFSENDLFRGNDFYSVFSLQRLLFRHHEVKNIYQGICPIAAIVRNIGLRLIL